MSDPERNEKLFNSNSDSDMENDNDNNFVLEVDDSPYFALHPDDKNYNPIDIDFNINPFNEDRETGQTEIKHQQDLMNDDKAEENEKEPDTTINAKLVPKHFPRVTSHPLPSPPSHIAYTNNCFTKDGKSGWVCLYCKNFNYEVRVQCNRCNLTQNATDSNDTSGNGCNLSNMPYPIANYSNTAFLMNCFSQKTQMPPLGESVIYSHSYSPKAKKSKEKTSKPFLSREGDWRCYNCNNLNFAFRVNCNRCLLAKADNQKIIQQKINTYANVQLVNKHKLD